MRRRVLVATLLLFAACRRLPVEDEVTIAPAENGDAITVSVTSDFWLDPPNDEVRARVDAARAAALANTDPWAIRFARLDTPMEERQTIEKTRGTVQRVTHAARIPADDLQQLFSDANITVDFVRGDGWRELRFYPGSDGRATREQREAFESTLQAWSRSVVRYFTAMDHLYKYMDHHPQRAEALFAALMEEKDAPPIDEEEERPLVDAVIHSMDEIAQRMDTEEGRNGIVELADLVFNPFPGRMVLKTPHDVLSSEGFEQPSKNELTIEHVDLFASLKGLEGRWISPDPLAATLHDSEVTAAQLAEAERKSTTVVSATEVTRAIREQLARPKAYVVRWRS
ncbi:MAG TPA: hypothetical protein VM733_18690 [Thermoanaerobaculia bacterium]|nr:hypothetical protein [Thermoanaerobaculia bacterium]